MGTLKGTIDQLHLGPGDFLIVRLPEGYEGDPGSVAEAFHRAIGPSGARAFIVDHGFSFEKMTPEVREQLRKYFFP